MRLLTGADNWRTCPLPAIGLRAMVVSDGPAGVRGITMDERNPSASLPCPSALGATWDPDLVQTLAAALGTEARSKGVDILLAPTINVMRTPLGGRGFESFGEDPTLISRLAVAFVRGLHQAGAAAAVKHYVSNDSETQRWTYDARIAEHVLRELYLVPFEACVREADVDLVDDRLQQGQWHHDDRTRPAAHAHPQGRMGLRRRGPVRLARRAQYGRDRHRRARPGHAGPGRAVGRQAGRGGAGRPGQRGHDRRQGAAHPAAGPPGRGDRRRPGAASDDRTRTAHRTAAPVLADPALLRRVAAAAFTLLRNSGGALPLDLDAIRSVAVIGPNAISPVTQGGGSATVPQVSVSTPAAALTEALAGLDPETQVSVWPGCVTWDLVPEPPRSALRDPDTGEPGVRLEFRTEDGALAAVEHRSATMFTWWDGLPEGVGRGGQGTIVLRTRYLAAYDGPHAIGAGGVGRLALTVNGIEVAAGHTDVPADPVEAMVRPGEIRATVYLAAGREAEIAICLRPDDWPQGPVAIRLGVVPAPDDDTLLNQAVEAARAADAAVLVVGSGPASESEGFDRPGLALPGRQDELVRRVAAVNNRTIVVVNAGMPVLMPWSDQVAAVGYAWLPGQEMGTALADVLLGQAEPGGRLPVTLPAAEADCPVLHSVPAEGRLEYREGLLIGYRGYDRAGTKPQFPFGHGLGYTTWAYESAAADAPIAAPDADLDVTVVLRNTGPRTGREIVQAYLEPPTADPGRPVRVLAAFAAVTAAPGERAEARLTVPARAFARYHEVAGRFGGWVRPSGEFTIRIGRSSADLPLHLRVKSFLGRTSVGGTVQARLDEFPDGARSHHRDLSGAGSRRAWM